MSPKNKGNYGKGKKDKTGADLAPEDEFVSSMEKLGKALEPHLKTIVMVTIAAVALSAVVVGYGWYSESQEAKATVLYQKALVAANTAIVPPLPAAEDDTGDGGDDAATPEATTATDEDGDGILDEFPSAEARANAVIEYLDQLKSSYGSTKVAAEARLLHATQLYAVGRYDDAEAMFRAYLGDVDSDEMRRVARERLGFAQEARALAGDGSAKEQGLRAALETFRTIQDDDEGPGRDRALYHEGRLLSALGDRDNAVAALQKALDIAPQSDMRYEINMRLVQLGAGPGSGPKDDAGSADGADGADKEAEKSDKSEGTNGE